MKRLLVFSALVVLVSASAFAQETAKCSFMYPAEFFKPASVALEAIAIYCDYEVVYTSVNDVPSAIMNLDGQKYDSVDEAIADFNSRITGFHAVVDHTAKTITVSRQASAPHSEPTAPAPPARQASVLLPKQGTEAYRLRRLDPNYDPCDYGDPGCHPPEPEQYQQVSVAGSASEAYRLRRLNPGYNPCTYGDSGCYGYSGNTGFGGEYYNYGGLYQHQLIQREIDRDAWGALKFKKGKEAFVENVEIWGCNQRLAQADEANNLWDHKVLVPVNCRPLTFRYSDGKQDWEVTIDEMIVPLRLQSTKNITLDQKFFQRARIRTSHQLYDLVEQADGSFKRLPRVEETTRK